MDERGVGIDDGIKRKNLLIKSKYQACLKHSHIENRYCPKDQKCRKGLGIRKRVISFC